MAANLWKAQFKEGVIPTPPRTFLTFLTILDVILFYPLTVLYPFLTRIVLSGSCVFFITAKNQQYLSVFLINLFLHLLEGGTKSPF